jgi:hypothetical protein
VKRLRTSVKPEHQPEKSISPSSDVSRFIYQSDKISRQTKKPKPGAFMPEYYENRHETSVCHLDGCAEDRVWQLGRTRQEASCTCRLSRPACCGPVLVVHRSPRGRFRRTCDCHRLARRQRGAEGNRIGASNKGRTMQTASRLRVASFLVQNAVTPRLRSCIKLQRLIASKILPTPARQGRPTLRTDASKSLTQEKPSGGEGTAKTKLVFERWRPYASCHYGHRCPASGGASGGSEVRPRILDYSVTNMQCICSKAMSLERVSS